MANQKTNCIATLMPEGMILHNAPFGFTVVPTDPYFAVSRKGEVWSLRSNKLCKISNGPGGYKTVGINLSGKTISRYVHRLVAITYIPVPTYLQGIVIEVNHISRDKSDNGVDNLEWVTPKSNVRHAYKVGAFQGKSLSAGVEHANIYSTKIDVRNLKSNKVITYDTLSAVVDMFNISKQRLEKHLNSKEAGTLSKNWCVFRLHSERNKPWPKIPEEYTVANSWDYPDGFWIFYKSENQDQLHTSLKMPKMAEFLGIALHLLQYNLKNDGLKHHYSGWVFQYVKRPNAEQMKIAPKTSVGNGGYLPPKAVSVTEYSDIVTMENISTLSVINTHSFSSMKKAVAGLNVPESSVYLNMVKNNGLYGKYRFEYVTD